MGLDNIDPATRGVNLCLTHSVIDEVSQTLKLLRREAKPEILSFQNGDSSKRK